MQADTLAILGDRVLPTETLNTGIARRVLDSVLHTPGGRINRTRIARKLDLDTRTVGRYLGILERRFLITLLPNLHGGITRASRNAPKGHAVDTASTCESLIRAGHDIASSPELLGQTLETWVVNQFLAAQGWAALTTEAFYWRDSRTGREVDLVLVDGRGRRLGVEVKLASSIGPRDLRGLRAMREFGGLHRGFVAYTGAGFEEVDDGVWALPLACLTSREALSAIHSDGVGRPSPGTAPPPSSIRSADPSQETTTMSDAPSTAPAVLPRPSVFLSYVHDDDYHNGLLVAFARAVEEACDYKGVPIELRLDKDTLQWGDDWSERLQQEVERTTFLLAMVTNRYVASRACREEFIQFRTKTQAAGYNGLLTLLVDAPNWDRMDLRTDPTARLIRDTINQYQWLEPETPFEDLEPGGRQFKRVARKVADELIRRIDRREADSAPADSAASADSAAPGGSNNAEDEEEDEEEQTPGLIELTYTIKSKRLPAQDFTVTAPIKGRAVPLSEIEDPIFSSGIIGPGLAIVPDSGPVVSPVDGEVLVAFTGHAYGIRSASGVELLIHVGMDTVSLQGEHFTPRVKQHDKVRRGQTLVDVDWKAVADAGYKTATPVVVTNATAFGPVTDEHTGPVERGDALFAVAPAPAEETTRRRRPWRRA